MSIRDRDPEPPGLRHHLVGEGDGGVKVAEFLAASKFI